MEARAKKPADEAEAESAVIPFSRPQGRACANDDEMIEGMIQDAMDALLRAKTVLQLSRARANRRPPGER